MFIKALSTFTAYDGTMRVFNKDDEGELRDDLAEQQIDAGLAVRLTDKPQLDHDHNGKAGGSAKAEGKAKGGKASSELGDARKAYKAAFGKQAGPGWDVATIEAKIAAKSGEAAAPPA